MIKITQAYFVQQRILRLSFSDNSFGNYDLKPLIDRQMELVMKLNDDDYFKSYFLELGALCWPNGLELSPSNIHRKLAEQHQLHYENKYDRRYNTSAYHENLYLRCAIYYKC